MIYITKNIIYIPKTCKSVGSTIDFTNLVTKTTYDASVTVDNGKYVLDATNLELESGSYSYSIGDYESGLAQVGDFNTVKKSYDTKISYKQYKK